MILQIFLYFFRRMVIRCFQCTHRCSQNFGHIFVFHFVEIAHIKNEALFLRKLQNRLLQKPLCTISVEIFVALYMREQEIIGIVGRKIPSFSFPCQKSQCLIHCNTIKPSRQFGIFRICQYNGSLYRATTRANACRTVAGFCNCSITISSL